MQPGHQAIRGNVGVRTSGRSWAPLGNVSYHTRVLLSDGLLNPSEWGVGTRGVC
jgi:hypothetical protein